MQPACIRVRSPSQALVGVHDNVTLVLALTRAVKQQLLHPIGGHVQPVLPRLTDLNSLGYAQPGPHCKHCRVD
jgi:hypothetical protein